MNNERTSLLGSNVNKGQQQQANNDNNSTNTNTNNDTDNTRCSIRFNIESNNNNSDGVGRNEEEEYDNEQSSQNTNPDFSFITPNNNYQGRRNTVVSWAGGAAGAGSSTIDRIDPSSHRRRATANSLFRRSSKKVIRLNQFTAPVVEMGRRELYAELPFVAVLGLQKKERSLSMAWSNAAALIENEELDNASLMSSAIEKGMDPNEKEERVRRMSVVLLDEMEGTDGVYLTLPLVVAVMIASMFTFNVGYSIGIMNTTEKYVFPGHSVEIWSVAVSVWCLGGLVGARLSGKWADTYGRKRALLLTAWPFVVGGWLQTCSLSMSMVIVARAIIGVACGATTVLVPIYLGELAPPNFRGYIGTMTQFTMVFGILFSDILSFFFANNDQWRLMVLPTAFCGMCPLLLESFLYESPRWLLGRNSDSDEARYIIQKLRGFRYDDEIETEVHHFLGALQCQSLNSSGDGKRGGRKGAAAELFSDRSVRLQLISSLLLQVSKMMSGITAVFFYSSLFFQGVIDNPLVGTTILGAINVCATYLALDLLNRYGRRTLLMVSSGGMFFSCVLLILSFQGYFGKSMPLIAVCMCVIFYGIGIGPIPNLIVTEMFVAKYVSTAMSICMQLSWTSNFFVGLFFPLMMKTLGAYSFGPFAAVLFLTFVSAWKWLPETQGTTPSELQARLIKRMSAVTYHQIGSSIAD